MNTQKPLTLADYTKPELIIPQLTTRATNSVMEELTEALHCQDGSVPHPHLFSSSLAALNLELLTSTVLNLGAAFPEVRVAALSRPRFALGRSSEPLPWLAPAFQPVDLVFLTLEPLQANVEVGRLVGTLQDLGRNRLRLDDLRRAATAEEMLVVLAQIPLVGVSELVRVLPIIAAPHTTPAPTAPNSRRWRR
jgi:mannitol/fructose-specific phosphotransferase system IIA component (Ntr-type)